MYKIVITNFFKKQLKKLVKKDNLLKNILKTALLNFKKQLAVSIGHGVYKIRLRNKDRGKSAGYRLYIFILEIEKILVPIAIYSKNNKTNITINEISDYLERTKIELQQLL